MPHPFRYAAKAEPQDASTTAPQSPVGRRPSPPSHLLAPFIPC